MVILLYFYFENQCLCTYFIHIFTRVVYNLVQPLFEEMKFFLPMKPMDTKISFGIL